MTSELAIALIMRWVHIFTAIVVVGGVLFYLLIYLPAARKALSEEERAKLWEPLMRRWKMFIHPPIILFLVSGFYTYLFVTRFDHEGQGIYHALFGMKFMLALGVFALGIIVTSTMSWSEKIRDKRWAWSLLLLMSCAVVMIAGYMRVMPRVDSNQATLSDQPSEVPEWTGDL